MKVGKGNICSLSCQFYYTYENCQYFSLFIKGKSYYINVNLIVKIFKDISRGIRPKLDVKTAYLFFECAFLFSFGQWKIER